MTEDELIAKGNALLTRFVRALKAFRSSSSRLLGAYLSGT